MEKIIDRPILATIFFIIVILLGIFSFMSSPPIELVPDADLPKLNVNYNWTGASPDIILRKVIIPAEEEIMQIKGVEEIKCSASLGRGQIEVEFTPDTKMNFAHVLLSERLNRLQRNLPEQVEKPDIRPYVPDDFEQQPLMTIGVIAKNKSIFALKRIAEKEILPHLKSIPGVERAELIGGVEPEIKIQTDLDRLKKYGISIYAIYGQIVRNFYTIQSISLRKERSEITLSLSENPMDIQEIQNIMILKQGEKKILLKDLANVYFGYQDLTTEMRFQGHPVIGFTMYKEKIQNTFQMVGRIKAKMQTLANRSHHELEFVIQRDESKELKKNLMKLITIAALILIIIFIILIVLFRDLKVSLLIFSSVFFSVFTTFTVIYLLRIPMNLLTLSGLALGFGLFVDNSVVVFDSIARMRERGLGLRQSAVEGSKAVFMPVLSSTFTTIIVFFSFAIFEGRLRVYYLPLAYVIAVSLASSVIVSFVLIPSLGSRIPIKLSTKKKKPFRKGKFMPFVLKYPMVVILPVLILLGSSYHTFKKEVSFGQFFSFNQRESIFVYLRFPASVDFNDIKSAILKFETMALEKPYEKEIVTNINSFFRQAYMDITFPEEIERTALPLQLKQELSGLATNLAGVTVYIRGFDQEPYYYSPETGSFLAYSIQIKGYNFERLMDFSNGLKTSLLNHKRIKEVEIETSNRFTRRKEKYYAYRLNRKKLKKLKIDDPLTVLYILTALLREKAGLQKIKFDEREMGIEIKASDVKDLELEEILEMNFQTPDGVHFRLADAGEVYFSQQKGEITRENQEYVAYVKWDYMGSAKSADRFHKTVYENLQVPPGFKKSLEEKTFRLTEEEQSQLLWAILMALGLIYIILAILYESFMQPFLVMLAIPLALIGVFKAFVWAGANFDSKAYIGVILMGGIVVNNAILLIDNINQHLKRSKDIIHAIVIGAKERIRPIFITTITTVLGMMPLIIKTKGAEASKDIWSALALCVVGGLTSSAILILAVLPICYYMFYRLRRFISLRPDHHVESSPASE